MIRNLLVVVLLGIWALTRPPSDSYIRARVVMLMSFGTSCSGIQVKTPSGKNVILSAGHCASLALGDSMIIRDETKKMHRVHVLGASQSPDILVLEGLPGLKGLDVAGKMEPHEHLRSFTHGKGLDTYKTDGEAIQEGETLPEVGKQLLTTVPVSPGSSGGAIVDDAGKLVGTVSVSMQADGGGLFSGIVRLEDIKEALKGL